MYLTINWYFETHFVTLMIGLCTVTPGISTGFVTPLRLPEPKGRNQRRHFGGSRDPLLVNSTSLLPSNLEITPPQLPVAKRWERVGLFHVASFEQLIKGTNSTSPCTRPCVFLLAFLETNPCPTLYPTLCFWKQLKCRSILCSQAFNHLQQLHVSWRNTSTSKCIATYSLPRTVSETNQEWNSCQSSSLLRVFFKQWPHKTSNFGILDM